MSVWTVGAFIDQLKTLLEARVEITALTPAVAVVDGWDDLGSGHSDTILLGFEAEGGQQVESMKPTPRYEEDNEINCAIRVLRPESADPANPAIKTARDRALLIAGEVSEQLRTAAPTVGEQPMNQRIDNWSLAQFPSPVAAAPGRVCVVAFEITYKARTSV